MIASITELCAADHRNDRAVIDRWVSNKSPDHVRAWIESGTQILVAETGSRPAGVSAATPEGEVLLLFIAPEAAGRGIGKTLLCHLETWLADRGMAEAYLESSLTAVAFYRRAGWRDLGIFPGSFDMPGHRMRKRLSP